MVEIVILIPVLFALYFLWQYSASETLLLVYLPCLMLVPLYMKFWVKGVFIDAASLVAVILALAGVIREYGRWRFTPVDVAVLCVAASAYWADAHYRTSSIGIFAAAQIMLLAVCPYLIGKTLIEPAGIRVRLVQRLVFCLVLIAVVSVWEFRMTSNIFQDLAERVMQHPAEWGARQMRWGFARVAGPYGHAITAGLVFSCGLILQLWLYATRQWPRWPLLRRGGRWAMVALTAAVMLGVFMAQSRGPWIGCGMGLIIFFVGLAKNRRRAAIVAAVAMTIAVSVTYVVLDSYTDVDFHKAKDLDQQNASYRRELFATYSPLVAQGGFWGWGTPFPVANGGMGQFGAKQPSIDNEYLRMAMAQGYCGTLLEIFILLATAARAVKLCVVLEERKDIIFVFALLGILVAISFTLTTVFLAEPMTQLLYLICGWVNAIQPKQARRSTVFQFQHVFV